MAFCQGCAGNDKSAACMCDSDNEKIACMSEARLRAYKSQIMIRLHAYASHLLKSLHVSVSVQEWVRWGYDIAWLFVSLIDKIVHLAIKHCMLILIIMVFSLIIFISGKTENFYSHK